MDQRGAPTMFPFNPVGGAQPKPDAGTLCLIQEKRNLSIGFGANDCGEAKLVRLPSFECLLDAFGGNWAYNNPTKAPNRFD